MCTHADSERWRLLGGAATLALALCGLPPVADLQTVAPVPLDVFARAAATSEREARPALNTIAANWRAGYVAMLLELAELSVAPRGSGGVSPARERLILFLEEQTGKYFGHDFDRWYRWLWSLPYAPSRDYAVFKGRLYENVDPRMRSFFPPDVPSVIRLDEVVWGGVRVNGIPPLNYPAHLAAGAARYLKDDHIVFGIALNGEARAYPKRILAWHELARDTLGGVELTIVYCTLCGTVIPYESAVGGQMRRLGTSGLLYRSNKLMFDEGTHSLWSTLEGRPVIGPLVGQGLELRPHSVVTTTWGEWRRLHPNTTVLALETGHERDYSEGAAYRDYFSSDRLMFSVPTLDNRLPNKAEVLVMRLTTGADGSRGRPVAISADFLRRRPLFQRQLAGRNIVVMTSPKGANRVFDAGGSRFVRVDADGTLLDDAGGRWTMTEEALVLVTRRSETRLRLPAQRAFWFGWQAQYPDTVLIK